MGPQFIGRDVPATLTEDALAGSGVQFAVIGDGQDLFLANRTNPSQFDVAATLGMDNESKMLKN